MGWLPQPSHWTRRSEADFPCWTWPNKALQPTPITSPRQSQSHLIQSFPLGFAFYDSQGQLLGTRICHHRWVDWTTISKCRRPPRLTTFANGEQIALLIGAPATITSAGGISLTDLLHTTAPILTGGGGEIGVYLVGPGAELLAASGKSPPENRVTMLVCRPPSEARADPASPPCRMENMSSPTPLSRSPVGH